MAIGDELQTPVQMRAKRMHENDKMRNLKMDRDVVSGNLPTPTRGSGAFCRVPHCPAKTMVNASEYCIRHHICEEHFRAVVVMIDNKEHRFCQKCSRLHELDLFEAFQRSCRESLELRKRRHRQKNDAKNQLKLQEQLQEAEAKRVKVGGAEYTSTVWQSQSCSSDETGSEADAKPPVDVKPETTNKLITVQSVLQESFRPMHGAGCGSSPPNHAMPQQQLTASLPHCSPPTQHPSAMLPTGEHRAGLAGWHHPVVAPPGGPDVSALVSAMLAQLPAQHGVPGMTPLTAHHWLSESRNMQTDPSSSYAVAAPGSHLWSGGHLAGSALPPSEPHSQLHPHTFPFSIDALTSLMLSHSKQDAAAVSAAAMAAGVPPSAMAALYPPSTVDAYGSELALMLAMYQHKWDLEQAQAHQQENLQNLLSMLHYTTQPALSQFQYPQAQPNGALSAEHLERSVSATPTMPALMSNSPKQQQGTFFPAF